MLDIWMLCLNLELKLTQMATNSVGSIKVF